MEVGKSYVTYPSKSDRFTVWNLSDLHLGNSAVAEDRLNEDVARIAADPYALWFGGGDYGEYISVRDRRFDSTVIANWIPATKLGELGRVITDRVKKVLWPIRDKCVGLVFGNHEKTYATSQEQKHMHAWLCHEMGVPNLGFSALWDVIFIRKSRSKPGLCGQRPAKADHSDTSSKRFYIHHGAGAAATHSGKLNRLINFMHSFRADVYMIGHVHDQTGKRIVEIGADRLCTTLVERVKLGIISGSYLRTYAEGITSYGEIKGYSPVNLGASSVVITPMTGEMHAEV